MVSRAIGLLLLVAPMPALAQAGARGAAWNMPEPADLVSRAIGRIVSQDRPGGLPIGSFANRTFGRVETANAVRAFLGQGTALPDNVFGAVQSWPSARSDDTLPCSMPATLGPPRATPVSLRDNMATRDSLHCSDPNALWLAITKIERGPLSHELYIWYATHFRTDVQGIVQESMYSFCERWLRVGGTWKYDGFVRVSKGLVAP